jgi:hypothetical protein
MMLAPALLALLLTSSPAATSEASPAATLAPLTDAERAVLNGTPEDAEPEKLGGVDESQEGRHYLTGDEWKLHEIQPYVKGVGGGYVGVGTDQCYLMIGWARSTMAWLTDYDPWVGDLHRAYLAFFERAETPADLVEWFSPKAKVQGLAVLDERWAGDPHLPAVRKVYAAYHEKVYWRLKRLAATQRKAGVPSFVTDQAEYDHVRALVKAGRVRPMLGNLLADKGLQGVAQAATKLGVPVRLVYLSNAEGYWTYPAQFKANMAALPGDAASLVVRTIAAKWTNGDYRYNLQTLDSFKAWLADDRIRSYKQIVPFIKLRSTLDVPVSRVDWKPGDKVPVNGGRLNKAVDGPPVPANPSRETTPPGTPGSTRTAPVAPEELPAPAGTP